MRGLKSQFFEVDGWCGLRWVVGLDLVRDELTRFDSGIYGNFREPQSSLNFPYLNPKP